MGQAYSWHPGGCPLNRRWVLPVPLLPDEVFSGWLVRAALAQGCDPLVLTGELWPKWRVWTLDCDRGVPDARLAVLERECGIPAEAFRASMLPPLMVNVAGRVPEPHEPWPWVRPFGRRNRRCVQGWQYCPSCLKEDGRPFLRLHWRLAWHVACGRHEMMLLDRCPHCGGPVLPHRLSAEDKTLVRCALCGADLRRARPGPAGGGILAMQQACDEAARSGVARQGNEDARVEDWFDLARFFTGWLRRCDLTARREFVRQLLPDAGEIERPALTLGVEALPLEERARLVVPAVRLASTGTRKMVEAALEAGLSARSFHTRNRLPALLEPVVAALPERGRSRRNRMADGGGPRSREAVERMWWRLQRKAGLA